MEASYVRLRGPAAAKQAEAARSTLELRGGTRKQRADPFGSCRLSAAMGAVMSSRAYIRLEAEFV
jgi:hypothetical protein